MTSILESDYIPPDRPYSQNELKFLRNRTLKYLRVGYYMVKHQECGHFYYAKKLGRKEQQLIEHPEDRDVGNCSVCWKIKRTPHHIKRVAKNMVNIYCEDFKQVDRLSYVLLDLEKCFYTWLYKEQF